MSDRGIRLLLLASVFAVATCGLIYELICGTLASYLLGDSVTQFSTVIGVYLFAMGIGSYLSRFVQRNILALFIRVEFLIGLVGGSAAALLFVLFAHVNSFRVVLYSLIIVIGTMVGLEIPLMLRILKGRLEFKELVSKVFTFDYIGALAASLLFPLVLVPHLGLVRSGFLFGMINTGVGLLAVEVLRRELTGIIPLRVSGWTTLVLLGVGFVGSDQILAWSEHTAYTDEVIYARSTPYQRIVLTRAGDDLRLHLNGNLQFSSRDEYRYHEALVHPGLSRLRDARRVLILGGGDGLAAREVLRYPKVEHVTLVDLDPAMTTLFASQDSLVELNVGALRSPKVTVVNADAFTWIRQQREVFDFIVVDFPDPTGFSVGKLYTTSFFAEVRGALSRGGMMAVQCTSPYVARRSFWCIDATLKAVGFHTEPYHAYVPSFGEWGFILVSHQHVEPTWELPAGLRFITRQMLPGLFYFPPDMNAMEVEVNRLNNQMLVRYFEEEWANYVH
jgi:spermidine synthase